jgi:YebC/PmpR family DNA-binding regulatory protein
MGRAFEYRRKSKEKRWGTMSRVFPKLAKAITLAAKDGGSDPESNAKLRAAINNAKAQNMPKDNIDTAIKRASGKDLAAIAEVNYEGKGPHGVLLFIECASDNTNRTVANLKTLFKKAGGEIVATGSLEFMFDRKSVIEFPVGEGMDAEEVELALMDAGLEEFEVNDGTAYAYGGYTSFGSLSQAVEELGIENAIFKLERVPNAPTPFNDEQLDEIETFIESVEEDEDVQAVFNNVG